MELFTKDNQKFNLGQFMHDQGKTLLGPRGRGGQLDFTQVANRAEDVVYRVRDNETGEESDFDAAQFLKDEMGVELDLAKNFEVEQGRHKAMRKAARYKEIAKDQLELIDMMESKRKEWIPEHSWYDWSGKKHTTGGYWEEKDGRWDAFMKGVFPMSHKRMENVIAGKTEEHLGKAYGTAVLDIISLVGRAPIAGFEAGLYKMTDGEHGRPLAVSMGRTADYGADIVNEAGDEATLTQHLETLKEAMRVDMKGVLADLAIESGRDPLTGIAFLTGGLGVAGAASSLKGTQMGMAVVKIAKRYKRVSAAAVATTKFTQKVHQKVTQGNVAKKFASKIVGEGVKGGTQGVIMNNLMGENKNTLNTFIIEGVEEGIFGGMMFVTAQGGHTLWSQTWDRLTPQEKKNAMQNKSKELEGLRAEGIHPTPEEAYSTIDITSPDLDSPIDAMEGMTDAEKLAAQDLLAMQLPVDQALPPGTSRKDIIKKRKNPQHETPAETTVRLEHAENERAAKKDLNEIKKNTEAAVAETETAMEKIYKETVEEIEQEDLDFDKEMEKFDEKNKKVIDEIQDPTRPTSFSTWKEYSGANLMSPNPSVDYAKFRQQEQKIIDEANSAIKPEEKTEGETEVEEGPKFIQEPTAIEVDPEIDVEGDAQVHEMTQEQYVSEKEKAIKGEIDKFDTEIEQLKAEGEEQGADVSEGIEALEERKRNEIRAVEAAHESQVQKAVSAGQEVAPEVLEKYPDMKPRSFDVSRKEKLKQEIQAATQKKTEETDPEVKPRKFVNVVDETKLEEINKRINAKLNPGRLHSNPMFDPELWVDMVHAGMIYTQKGINNFADWSAEMTKSLGENAKPFLRSVYNAVHSYPEKRQFDADLAVKLFEYGGILREEGVTGRPELEKELQETFGEDALSFADFIEKGLSKYPGLEQIQELAYEQVEDPTTEGDGSLPVGAGESVGREGEGDQASGQPITPGVAPRDESGINIRPDDADVPGNNNPHGLEETEGEQEAGDKTQQKQLAPDPYTKTNLDLRGLPPVEMTPKARSEMNAQAAEILERVKNDPSSFTNEDRLVLRQYTGQGGLDVTKMEKADLVGALNQHYTSYPVAKFAWDLLESMGLNLKGAEALEPTAGVGNFAGMAPKDVKWRLNEVDQTSGEILGLLYPEAETSVQPFESYTGPKKDLVVTNVPFLANRGKYAAKEEDARYSSIKSLHNYVMMKSIDQLNDNGVGLMITSTWTMDAKNPEFRKQLNQKAELIGAIRIPMGAFKKNTQYAGSADMLILRKRTAGEMQNQSAEERTQDDFVNTIPVDVELADGNTESTTRSKWFETHRSQAIGEWEYGSSKGGLASSTALKVDNENFDAALEGNFQAIIEEMRDSYVPGIGAALPSEMVGIGPDLGRAKKSTPKFGLEIKDGVISRSDQYGTLRALRTPEEAEKGISDAHLETVINLMETAKELRDNIAEGNEVKHLQDRAISLLERYTSMDKYHRQPQIGKGKDAKLLFPGVTEKIVTVKTDSGKSMRKKVGLQFKHNAMLAYTSNDNRYALLRFLYNKQMNGYSDLLTKKPKSSIAPEPKKGDMKSGVGVKDYVIQKYGVFRTSDAQEAWKGDPEEFHNAMMEQPDLNKHGEEFIHDRDYLVGNLRDKLEYSRKHNLTNQVAKLEAALPEQRTAETVDKNPISTWWSFDALSDFAKSLKILGQGQMIQRVQEGMKTKFRVTSGVGANAKTHELKREEPIYNFVEVVLNQRNAVKVDPNSPIDKPKMIEDFPATVKIRDQFRDSFSAWADGAGKPHAEKAAENYNINFASKAVEEYSQEDMFIKGVAPVMFGGEFKPFPSQLSAVRMVRNQGGGILAHDVGNGKTLAAIFSFAEQRQSGKAKKAFLVAPAGTLGMWEENFNEAIQGVNVKLVHPAPAALRRADLMDAAANDYDVVLVSHDAAKSIPLRKSNVYIEEEIAEARAAMEKLAQQKRGDSRLTQSQIKGIETRIGKLEAKLEMNSKAEKDALGGIFYEDLGADMLIVDEAHYHKNVFNHTNEYADKRFLKIGGKSSHMADDMVHKSRYTHEINNRGNVLMLTATPTPNSILEIYGMLKFVAPWEWEQRGINSIDDFIRNFIEIGPMNQATLSGTTADKEGVLGFKNGKALNDIVRSWVDYKEATPESQIGRPESEKKTGIVEPNDEQLNMLGEIAVLDGMDYKTLVNMGINPVTLTTRAKALAVDPAFEDPKLIDQYPDFVNRAPKLKTMMDDLAREFKDHPDRSNIIFLQQYRVQDWRVRTDPEGNQIEWPAGFGGTTTAEGQDYTPNWMTGMTPSEIQMVEGLMRAEPVIAEWDQSLLDKNGVPKAMTPDTIEKVKPLVDEENGKVYLQEQYVRQNLHEEFKKYAINKLGMDPDRVFIVNGAVNNKPEDKTRLETLSSLGKVSLIIGNSVMAEGLNLQEKGNAIFTADVPWEPKSVTQQNGRMLRSRKDLDDKVPVKLYNYALKYSADRKLYEILERKESWNRELNYGNWDNLDNSINNVEEAAGNLSDELEVPANIVEGFKTKFQVSKDKVKFTQMKKEARKAYQAVERAQKNFDSAAQKIENAENNIKKGIEKHRIAEQKVLEHNKAHPDKPKNLPEPYDPSFHEDIIKRNMPAFESGQKFIDEAMKNYEPYARIEEDSQTNDLADALLVDAKRNNWASIEDNLETEEQRVQYDSFLQKAFPKIYHMYRRVADMSAASILKEPPVDQDAAVEQVSEHLRKYQGGFANTKALGYIAAISASVALAPAAPNIVAGSWLIYGLGHAGNKLWRTQGAKVGAWSLRARLQEMDGFERVAPLVEQTVVEQQRMIAGDEMRFKKIIKGLSDEELNMIPDFIEGDITTAPDPVIKAARELQVYFAEKAQQLQQAEIDIPPDQNYYPRMIRMDMMQKMKEDTDLLTRNAIAVVKDPLNDINNLQDAYAVLLNMYDGTAEMRQKKRAKDNHDIIQSIVKKHPEIDYAGMVKVMGRMKNKYGLQMLGNIKYGRRAPKMLPEMYYRDPRDVMQSYIPGISQTLAQRKNLGDGNNNAVNQFLNRNFPVVEGGDTKLRDDVASWFRAELSGQGFSSAMGVSPVFSKRLRAYQYWTKLGLPVVASAYAPVKNVLGAFNLSIPLAGGRSTAMGFVRGLGDATGGFKAARMAGAISGNVISDIYGDQNGIAKTSFQKLSHALKEWGTFGISEKFVRSWAFHTGRNLAGRLYHNATTKNSARDLEKLTAMIGENNYNQSVANGGMTVDALDQAGVFMANKIGGKTSAFDLAGWMNTPEGRILMQFHSMAYAQTNIFKNEILMPAFRKENRDFRPLLKWGAAVGISAPTMVALAAAVPTMLGGDPPEEKEADNPVYWAWNTLMLSNMVFATGLYGDFAAGLDTQPGVTPLITTFTGPTLNTVMNAVADLGGYASKSVMAEGFGDEDIEDAHQHLINFLSRELPGLNLLKKTGNIPAFE